MADRSTGNSTSNDSNQAEVKSPKEAGQESVAQVKATNADVERAGTEAASRLKGQTREAANTTDAILGADDKHGINVKKAQAASFGEEYDPKNDPELNPADVVPAPSQNQNNLKHPEDVERNDPHASRNYLGQPI